MSRRGWARSLFERLTQDPLAPGLVLMGALLLGGFLAVGLAWRGVARAIHVPLQLPEIVSGGIVGLALIAMGAALIDVQLERGDSAEERRRTDGVLDEVASLRALAPQIRERVRRGRAILEAERSRPTGG